MGNSFLLIVIGLLLFYVVISDKFYCVEGFLSCLGGKYVGPDGPGVAASIGGNLTVPGPVSGVGQILGVPK